MKTLLLVAFGSVIIPTLTVFLNGDVLGVHRIALKINTSLAVEFMAFVLY